MKRGLIALVFMGAVSAHALSPEAFLQNADTIRNPQLDYSMSVKITSHRPNKAPKESSFKVYVKGREKSVVQTLTPAVDRGRILLMNGANFWGYLPSLSQPIRISLQEKLLGDVANGDIARANFSGDYTVTEAAGEKIEGQTLRVLDLKAKSENVTYGRVVLKLDKTNDRPVSAEFYAFSGRLLKTCSYEQYKSLAGTMRPSQLIMRDALVKDQYSVLEYGEMTVKPIPEKLFSKDYMKKLREE